MLLRKGLLTDLLLQLIFPVIDGDGVVVSVKSMNQSLDTWDMSRLVKKTRPKCTACSCPCLTFNKTNKTKTKKHFLLFLKQLLKIKLMKVFY